MGERAVIVATSAVCMNLCDDALYTQWCGGRDFVEAFLCYCRMQGYTSPEKDKKSLALLQEVMTNYMGDECTEIEALCLCMFTSYEDEGVYIIKNWKVIGRRTSDYIKLGGEQCRYDLIDLLLEIDAAQPEDIQLGEMRIKSKLRRLRWVGYHPRRTLLQRLVKKYKTMRNNRHFKRFFAEQKARSENED